jgi:hypothetical protein
LILVALECFGSYKIDYIGSEFAGITETIQDQSDSHSAGIELSSQGQRLDRPPRSFRNVIQPRLRDRMSFNTLIKQSTSPGAMGIIQESCDSNSFRVIHVGFTMKSFAKTSLTAWRTVSISGASAGVLRLPKRRLLTVRIIAISVSDG